MHRVVEILKNIGISLAVVVALANLWEWRQRHTRSLVAEIEYGAFAYPTDYFESTHFQVLKYKSLKTDPEVIFDTDNMKSIRIVSKKQIDEFVKDHLNEPIGIVQQPLSYSLLKGLYVAKIRNKGDKRLESIVVKLPHVLFYSIERETGDKQSGQGKDIKGLFADEIPVIPIDSIAAAEEVTLYAWSSYEPHAYLFNDISIRHSGGKGDVTIRGNNSSQSYLLRYPLFLGLAIIAVASLWLFITRSHALIRGMRS